jgi:hypothetical protein
MRLRVAFVGIAAAVVSLVSAAPRSRPPVLVSARCYALTFGQWTIGSESLSLHTPLPDGIALTDSLFQPAEKGRPAEYWAVRLRSAGTENRRAFWSSTGADSLKVILPAWWSTGIVLSLPARGDSLVGRADIYVDYEPAAPTYAAVTAHRQACPTFKIQ